MALPLIGKITFFCLISHADDEGRLKTDIDHTATAWLFVPPAEVAVAYSALVARKMIQVYVVDDEPCVQVNAWSQHQRLDHPIPSLISPPPAELRIVNPPSPPDNSAGIGQDRTGQERKGPEGTGGGTGEALSIKPANPLEEWVAAQLVLRGIRRRPVERARLVIERATARGVRDIRAYSVAPAEAGRGCFLDDQCIGFREEDNEERKEQELMGSLHRIGDVLAALPQRTA